jgi:hypothetical protein
MSRLSGDGYVPGESLGENEQGKAIGNEGRTVQDKGVGLDVAADTDDFSLWAIVLESKEND